MELRTALTFDDVLLEPAESAVLPAAANLQTRVTRNIELNVPLISAAMDTVTEAEMAIAIAQAGGLGVLHRNATPKAQAEQVTRVKRFESGIVNDPITLSPEQTLAEARALQDARKITGFPVIDPQSQRLVGIVTNRDLRFCEEPTTPIRQLMTSTDLATVQEPVDHKAARAILQERRIEKLLVVDSDFRCTGLITVKDIERAVLNPHASKDRLGRLLVAAATTTGDAGFERTEVLMDAGADVIVIDTAHGHSVLVRDAVARVRRLSNDVQIMAGNVATSDGAKSLIDAGADAVKVGIGPGSICTTRIVAGVGVPQLTALGDAVAVADAAGVPVIADGGIRYSGDLAKAIAAGASCVMIGSMLAGTDESPGELVLYQGRSYKAYRGMGSLGAMARGSADRYFQAEVSDFTKYVPEGVEGQVPYKGPTSVVVHQLLGGLRAAMGYTGCGSVDALRAYRRFVQVTNAGMGEGHVHGVMVTREPPNYPTRPG